MRAITIRSAANGFIATGPQGEEIIFSTWHDVSAYLWRELEGNKPCEPMAATKEELLELLASERHTCFCNPFDLSVCDLCHRPDCAIPAYCDGTPKPQHALD